MIVDLLDTPRRKQMRQTCKSFNDLIEPLLFEPVYFEICGLLVSYRWYSPSHLSLCAVSSNHPPSHRSAVPRASAIFHLHSSRKVHLAHRAVFVRSVCPSSSPPPLPSPYTRPARFAHHTPAASTRAGTLEPRSHTEQLRTVSSCHSPLYGRGKRRRIYADRRCAILHHSHFPLNRPPPQPSPHRFLCAKNHHSRAAKNLLGIANALVPRSRVFPAAAANSWQLPTAN